MTGDTPEFTGITSYRDPGARFSFRYPWDWHLEALDQDRDGVMLKPDSADPDTYFASWISELADAVTARDLDELQSGFDSGLATLPDLEIIASCADTFGDIIRLDRELTFTDGTQTRQRRVWAIYADTLQLVLIYQGATVDRYARWRPMGNYCYATLELAHGIWHATDPDLDRPALAPAET